MYNICTHFTLIHTLHINYTCTPPSPYSRDARVRQLELELAAAPREDRLERMEAELRTAAERQAAAPKQQQLDRYMYIRNKYSS